MANNELELHDPELKALFSLLRNSAGFDRERFLALLEDTDENTVLNILARFRETLATAIQAAAASNDGAALGKVFHKVAGSAELLGFSGLGLLSRELDNLLRQRPDVNFYAVEIAKFGEISRGVLTAVDTQCPGLKKYLA